MSQVEKYISEYKIENALSECLKTKQYYLGLLIAKITNKNTDFFCQLKHSLMTKTKEISVHKTPIESKNISKPPKTMIKTLCNFMSPQNTKEYFNKFSKGNYTWNNIELVTHNKPDYYVVINAPPMTESIIPEKTIVFQMEPYMYKNNHMWGSWANPDKNKFFKVCDHKTEFNNNEWHLSKTYTELQTFKVEKSKKLSNVLSTVLSSKYQDPGHVKRVDFVKFLDSKNFPVHVFGNNKWDYKDYKGSLPVYCKDNAMFQYKYVFNAENNNIKNYYTEKLIDGILSECLVFYSGCYNVKEYIDEKAFVHLELNDFEKDYKIIKKAIEDNLWEQRLPYILKMKKKILEEYQFFPRIENIIKNKK